MCLSKDSAVAKALSRRPVIAEAWVRSQVSPCEICGGRTASGTGFSPSISVYAIVMLFLISPGSCFPVPVSLHQFCILIFFLISSLSEGREGQACELSNKAMLIRISGYIRQKRAFTLHTLHCLMRQTVETVTAAEKSVCVASGVR
jgi:hypothetical protein